MAIRTPSATIVSADDPTVAQVTTSALVFSPNQLSTSQVDSIGNVVPTSNVVTFGTETNTGNLTFNTASNNSVVIAGITTTDSNIFTVSSVNVLNTDKDIFITGIDQRSYQQLVYVDEPGGANYEVQFNDAGDLNGVSSFTFNPNTKLLQVDNLSVRNSTVLGDADKLNIGGGMTGQVLVTDGGGKVRWGNTEGTGTVTGVGLSAGTTGLTVTSSTTNPITSAGIFTIGGVLSVTNGGTGLSTMGAANSYLRVNAAGTAMEYTALPTAGTGTTGTLGGVKVDGTSITINNGVISATGGGGGGAGSISVQQNSNSVGSATTLNFVNSTVTVSSGVATITSAGGGGLSYTPLNKAGDTMSGPLLLNGIPSQGQEAVTKQYVDNLISGFTVKLSARTATSSNITATYVNGIGLAPSGPGATLTGTGPLGTINGVTLTIGDRILVKNQTAAAQNGMYELTQLNPFILTRTVDFNSSASIQAGDAFFIGEGTLVSTQWVMTTPGTINVGTSAITFTQFGGPGSYSGGTGISVSSNTITNTGILSVTGSAPISASTNSGAVTLSFTQPTVGTGQGGTGLTTIGTAGQVLRVNSNASGLEWGTVSGGGGGGGSGTVTSVSVVNSNGFSGTVTNSTVTPAITISTTVNGLLKGNNSTGVISAAVSGSDYAPATSGTSVLAGNGSGGFSSVTIGSGLSFSNGTLTATGGGGGGGSGDVVGPSSSTDNAIARFDQATGKVIQNSSVTISDTGAITAPAVGNIIPFYYDNQSAFPNAATYHGALAHSHSDGKVYFAHSGNWNALANASEVVPNTDTTYSLSADDVSGQASKKNITLTAGGSGTGTTSVTLVAGSNITLTRGGTTLTANEITIAASGGVGGATALSGLSDVAISSATDEQILKYSSSSGKWVNANNVTLANLGGLPLTGGTLTGVLSLNADPTSALQAATKQYVDNLVSGLTIKVAARTATSANIAGTYNNGTNGVGASITGTGALGAINAITLAVGDRILVKNQTTATQNGMYELTTLNPFVLTRTIDFNSSASIQAGDAFFVGEGTLASTQWVMTTSGSVVVGTTSIIFTQFGGPGTLTAGSGISINNNQISNTGLLSITGGGGVTATTNTSGAVTLGFNQPTVGTGQGGTGLTTIGTAGQVLRVNSNASALEWGTVSGGGGGSGGAIEQVVFRYGTDQTFQASAGGGLVRKTSGVTVTINSEVACTISLSFSGYSNPPKSITYYSQNATSNVWRVIPVPSSTSFTLTGTGSASNPDLANLIFGSTNPINLQPTYAAVSASGTQPYLVIVIGF